MASFKDFCLELDIVVIVRGVYLFRNFDDEVNLVHVIIRLFHSEMLIGLHGSRVGMFDIQSYSANRFIFPCSLFYISK